MKKLRGLLLGCGLTEELKWGKPCYMFAGTNIIVMAGFKDHCVLIFANGALLADPAKILIKPGEHTQAARQARFKSLREIEEKAALIKAYAEEAMAAEKAGVKVQYKKITEHKIPEELQTQLDAKPKLKAAFQVLTPGRQRAYLIFISGAKQSQTRAARVEKCTPQILAGKGWND